MSEDTCPLSRAPNPNSLYRGIWDCHADGWFCGPVRDNYSGFNEAITLRFSLRSEEYYDVSEHQDAGQLRAARDRR